MNRNAFKINRLGATPLPVEIANAIRREIERGELKAGNRLPSINRFNKQYRVARDTVEKAYRELKKQHYITSVPGKGYFVTNGVEANRRILLVFNKLSSFKKNVYYGFINTLGKTAEVDLYIHHNDISILEDILRRNPGNYHYYVIIPHFSQNTSTERIVRTLQMVPAGQLLLLDKDVPGLKGDYMSVYQDFRNDIYETLADVSDIMRNYKRICIVLSEDTDHHAEIVEGIREFGKKSRIPVTIAKKLSEADIKPGIAFIVVCEPGLSTLIKLMRKTGYRPGREIGVISFNEAARLLEKKENRKVRNAFTMIRRKSF